MTYVTVGFFKILIRKKYFIFYKTPFVLIGDRTYVFGVTRHSCLPLDHGDLCNARKNVKINYVSSVFSFGADLAHVQCPRNAV